MLAKLTLLTAWVILCPNVRAVLTTERPVTMSTVTQAGSFLVDNKVDTSSAQTSSEASPWMNIQLSESATVRSVVIITDPAYANLMVSTTIRVGIDPIPTNNAVCLSGIDRDGVYQCNTLLTGTYVGAERSGQTAVFDIREFWAYSWVPFDETNSVLSADIMPNLTLSKSVHLVSSPILNEGIKMNSLFSTGPATNCYWSMDLGSSMHVKAVIIIGDWDTAATTLVNWVLTVGDIPNPMSNKSFLPISGNSGGLQMKTSWWGQFVSIIRINNLGPLVLGYVGVFATTFDCSLTNTITVTGLPGSVAIGSSQTFTVVNSLNAACIKQVSVVLSGTNELPAFMSFNPVTKQLTVTPGSTDIATLTLDFTVKTLFDGMAASQTTTISKVITIWKLEIGSGAIANQDYQLGTSLTLVLPTIVTNPLGVNKLIVWSASPIASWLVLGSSTIGVWSSDPTLIGTNAITITAKDTISGLSVSNSFNLLFKCTTAVNCSASSTVDITHFVTDTTLKTITKCQLTPSFCTDTTSAYLTSVGFSASPPVGFATISRSSDNTYQIQILPSDLLLTGLTYEFQITFTNSFVSSVTQPADRNFQVFVKCLKSVNCQNSVQSDVDFYITLVTTLTIPACLLTPSVCENTTTCTLISTGATPSPGGFATVSRNLDNTYKIVIVSSDTTLAGSQFKFAMLFADSSLAPVTQSTQPSFTVAVKQKNTDCSAFKLNNMTYYLTEKTEIIVPPCFMNPSFLPDQTLCALSSIGTDLPFQTSMVKNVDNSYKITFFWNNTSIIGWTYEFELIFTNPSVVFITQLTSPTFKVTVDYKLIDCSASSMKNLTYIITQKTQIIVPACVIHPQSLPELTTGKLTPIGSISPPAGFATIIKNSDNSYKITLISNDFLLSGKEYQFLYNFSYPGQKVTQPASSQFSVMVCEYQVTKYLKQLQKSATIDLTENAQSWSLDLPILNQQGGSCDLPLKVSISFLIKASFIMISKNNSLQIDDISIGSKSGIQPGLFLLKITVEDSIGYDSAILSLYVNEPPKTIQLPSEKPPQQPTPEAKKEPQLYTDCHVEKISKFGLVTIKFSEDVLTTIVPQNLTDITPEFLNITYVQQTDEWDIVMTYKVKNFTQTHLEVQLTFNEPQLVSATIQRHDEIEINISKFFLIPTRAVIEADLKNEQVKLVAKLPLMARSQAELGQLEGFRKTMKATSIIAVATPSIAQFYYTGIMKRLWTFYNAMQLIESYNLMAHVEFSINAQMLTDGYHDFINVKILPDSLTKKIVQFFNNSDAANNVGKKSQRILSAKHKFKVAVIALASTIAGILVLTIIALVLCWRRISKNVKDKVIKVKHIIFFNGPIRLALELYYPTLRLSLRNIVKNDQSESTMILSGVKVAICAALIPFSLNFCARYADQMEKKDFHLTYGALFTNVERYNKPKAMYYPFVFLVHRFLLAVIISCIGFNLILQVFLLTHVNLLFLCWFVVVWPMDSLINNLFELVNGFLVLMLSYFSFSFSDYVPDPKLRFKFGKLYIAIIIIFFAYNLTFQLVLGIQILKIEKEKRRRIQMWNEAKRIEQLQKEPRKMTMRQQLEARMKEVNQEMSNANNISSIEQSNDQQTKFQNSEFDIVQHVQAQDARRRSLFQQDEPKLLNPKEFAEQQEEANRLNKLLPSRYEMLFGINQNRDMLIKSQLDLGEERKVLGIEVDYPGLGFPIPKQYAKQMKEAKRQADLERSQNANIFSLMPNTSLTLTGLNSPRVLSHLEEMEQKVLEIEEDHTNYNTQVPTLPKPNQVDWSELMCEHEDVQQDKPEVAAASHDPFLFDLIEPESDRQYQQIYDDLIKELV